jgi:hypothetical protein
VAQPGDQLPIGARRRRLAGDVAMASVVLVALTDESLEPLVHGAGTENEQVVIGPETTRHLLDELPEVLETMRLAGSPRGPTAALTHRGIVPDMTGGAVVRRHV